jgi:hypothetical protein
VLGGPPTEMAKALGAVPTLIPMPDVYQSLDKGVVDAGAAPWEAVQAFRLYEVAKNFTIAPFYAAYFSICANKQKWQSLPKEVRDSIMSVSGLTGRGRADLERVGEEAGGQGPQGGPRGARHRHLPAQELISCTRSRSGWGAASSRSSMPASSRPS